MMDPKFTEGSTVDYFGIQAYVYEVTPYSDYCWQVVLHVGNDGEEVTVKVPTDYHTSTGENAWDEDDESFPWN